MKKKLFTIILVLFVNLMFSQPYVTTLAGAIPGDADGTQSGAQLRGPLFIAVESNGNMLFSDGINHKIKRVTQAGVVTSLNLNSNGLQGGYQDGPIATALFKMPQGLVIDASGNIFIADSGNHKIRKIDTNGNVTTFAGSTAGYLDGTGTAAQFDTPSGLVFDTNGNLYVTDYRNHRIRKITPSGVVSTFSGIGAGYNDGTATTARFFNPYGITIDATGNLYITDLGFALIRRINSAGTVTTIAGFAGSGDVDGPGNVARFLVPTGIMMEPSGDFIISDKGSHKIKRMTPAGVVTTIAGTTEGYLNGYGDSCQFYMPNGIVAIGDVLYVADIGNTRIRKIVDAITLSENNFELKEISLYPNPTNSMFTVEVPNDSVKTISVVDITGKVVATSNVATVDVSNLASGIYVVKVETLSGKTGAQKLVRD